ncbi:MAG: TVP38/TMEM64 family protein [Leptolyngbyaceae bacterium]|nr:TVP38/TMEM64 family protein [Leptolyngbyaceae bacterium]
MSMPPFHLRLSRRRFMIFGVAFVSCLFTMGICAIPQFWWTTLLDRNRWVEFFAHHPTWGVLLFLMAHTVAAVVGVPGTVLVVIGGVVFGLVWGTVWSVLGATLGATLGAIAAFGMARYCFRHWVERRWSHHPAFKTLNRLLQQNELNCVLAIRFVPISPFSIVNILFGLSRISFTTYVVGTVVGIIPGTLAYTWLGVAGQDAWSGRGLLSLALALGALALLSIIPVLLKRCRCL